MIAWAGQAGNGAGVLSQVSQVISFQHILKHNILSLPTLATAAESQQHHPVS